MVLVEGPLEMSPSWHPKYSGIVYFPSKQVEKDKAAGSCCRDRGLSFKGLVSPTSGLLQPQANLGLLKPTLGRVNKDKGALSGSYSIIQEPPFRLLPVSRHLKKEAGVCLERGSPAG